MWRLKLKETIERLTVLDCKSWTCGSPKVQQQHQTSTSATTADGTNDDPNDDNIKQNNVTDLVKIKNINSAFGPGIFLSGLIKCNYKKEGTNSSSSSDHQKGGENYRKKISDKESQLNDDILGAITWSGAIICGWYASQILCLRGRNLGWGIEDQNKFIKFLHVPTRAIHRQYISSHLVFASPPTQFQEQNFPLTFLSKRVKNEEISFLDSCNNKDHSVTNDICKIQQKCEPQIQEIKNVSDESTSSSSTESSSSSSKPPRKQSLSEAVKDLVKLIAENEYKAALLYLNEKDYEKAVPHLKLATNHGHPSGIFNLGVCFENGWGVKRNLQSAMECYQLASGLGHPKATFNLGVFYGRGVGGLQQSDSLAKKCILTAAKLGQPEAKLCLKEMAIHDEEIAKYIKDEEKNSSSSFDSSKSVSY